MTPCWSPRCRLAEPAATPRSGATQVARAAATAPQASAFAPAGEDSRPFYQRALSFVPLIGGSSAPTQSQPEIASVVPATPQTVTAPLPPRRALPLRTTQLQGEPAAAYASHPPTR
jgi:hypothetical protein